MPGEPQVTALLVCRSVEKAADGTVHVHDVLDLAGVAGFPGDAGPMTFVAFVRGMPEGRRRVAFRVEAAGDPERRGVDVPVEITVPPGLSDRQVAVYGGFGKMPVERGGWYRVEFRVDDRTLAENRFGVGVRAVGARPA